ncbi:MAG: DNA ligase-associated metallophosphoesterase [Marinoscillum sp.]|jgi:DNA ligase-associated metallophosphoesterase
MKIIEVLGEEYSFVFKEQNFTLNAEKTIYWQEQQAMILSDIHLGKAGHFRKHGIPIPREIHIADFQRMNQLIELYQPKRIIFLGDLFHSDANEEWYDLVYWSQHHQSIEQTLVLGNHDKSTSGLYNNMPIALCEKLQLGPFEFTHEPRISDCYNIAGHIHPSVTIRGLARQTNTLPCFYFGKTNAILPAFGTFTGSHPIIAKSGDTLFAIAEGELVHLTG